MSLTDAVTKKPYPRCEIRSEPVYHLYLTVSCIEALLWLSEHHYDSACKSLSILARVDRDSNLGLLRRWERTVRANRENGDDVHEMACEGTWRDLDLISKTCEGVRAAVLFKALTDAQGREIHDLCSLIAACYRLSPGFRQCGHVQATDKDRLAWTLAPGRW